MPWLLMPPTNEGKTMIQRRRLLLAAASGVLAATAARADTPVVRIGYQLPLTGNTAQYGQDFRSAAEIALERFNKPGKPFRVDIVYEDSRSDAREGVAIARKFVDDRGIVAVLGDFTSGVSIASGQVYGQAGMPQLSQTASHPDFTKISKWQFRNITTQAQEGPYNAAWLLSKGYRKVAVIAEQTDWGQSVVAGFETAFKAGGGEVVFSEFFNRGLQDFRPIITKIGRAKPDVIYTGFFYEDAAQFLKQVHSLGVTTPIHSTSAAYNQQLVTLAGPDAEGLHLTATFLPTSTAPGVQDFVAAWKAKNGGAEPGQFPAQAYDAVGILLAAISRAWPNVTRERVRDELAKTSDYPGVTGVTTFDVNREPAKQLTKAEVKNGTFLAVKN
jgi:branched-chain amino acid transport system substrate-binding protein